MTIAGLIQVPLTPFDHLSPRAYFHFAYYLPLKAGITFAQAFDVLHRGLHLVFVEQPWLGGRICNKALSSPGWRPGSLILHHPPASSIIDGPVPRQLRFNELSTDADVDVDYESLRELGFPLDGFRDAQLAPPSAPFFADIAGEGQARDVFAAQANFLPGGCILVAAIHHVASDQGACFQVLSFWGKYCAALQTGAPPPEPLPASSHDRQLLRRIWDSEKKSDVVDPEGWRLVGPGADDLKRGVAYVNNQPLPQEPAPVAPGPKTNPSRRKSKSGVFYISPERFAALGRDMKQEHGAASSIAATDALAALLWRCFMRVRAATRQQQGLASKPDTAAAQAVLMQVNDGRFNYSPAMPPKYLGNLFYMVPSTLPLETLIDPKTTVGAVAAVLRRNAMTGVDSAALLNLFGLLDGVSSYTALGQAIGARAAAADETWMMVISSLVGVSMKTLYFGDGPVFGNRGFVEAVRPLADGYDAFTRICFILPRNSTGGVEFVTNLYQDEYELLMEDNEFRRYVWELCWPKDK